MKKTVRRRLSAAIAILAAALLSYLVSYIDQRLNIDSSTNQAALVEQYQRANSAVDQLEVKGRAPMTGYDRSQFGSGWEDRLGCSVRDIILNRDLTDVAMGPDCKVESGRLIDPYSGDVIEFRRGSQSSADVQIDHVVALSDAWQKGAQEFSQARRVEFANDPQNLLAVSGPVNQQKSGSDAATWLPPQRSFRCQYVSRQIMVKSKYGLWVTRAEKQAMKRVLATCL